MMEFIGCMFPFVIMGIFAFLCWVSYTIYNIYYNYRVKKNRAKHPEWIELVEKRKALCDEYHWWSLREEDAVTVIDGICERARYFDDDKKFTNSLKQPREQYRIARENLDRLSPLIEEARRAEDEYRKEHNIRHW